jgi:hypothetical protein
MRKFRFTAAMIKIHVVVSELLHRVEKWWDTDVSEDHGASIIRVK